MGLAFTCTQHLAVHYINKENFLTDPLVCSCPNQPPSPLPHQTVWVCVYLCVDAFPGETNRAWQSENKQSADVCVGIVSAIMLRRRHFSLIQGFFFFLSYQVCREKDTKQAYMRLVRKLRITAWTKIPHSLKSQQKRWGSSSLFQLAVLLLQEGHFFVWCVCRILRCLPLYVASDLNELYQWN